MLTDLKGSDIIISVKEDEKMSRVTDRKDWKEIWMEDKHSMIETMRRNLASDIVDGNYDLLSLIIQKQIVEIKEYENNFIKARIYLKQLDEYSQNKWCYYDLKKRGVID